MVDIRFGDLKIGNISNASGVFAGSNELDRRSHSSKRNQAFGTIRGEDNRFRDLRTQVRDRDDIDLHAGRGRKKH